MKTKIIVLTLSLMLLGCATTYKPPASKAPVFPPANLNASKAQIMKAVKTALITDGHQITYADEESGIISSSLKNQRLRSAQANCGTTGGLDYLEDNRTSSKIGYGAIVSDKSLTLKLNIESEYKPGSVAQNITLTCQSTTALEDAMLKKIAGILKVASP